MKNSIVIPISISPDLNDEIEKSRKELKIQISRSALFREGAKLYIKKLQELKESKI